MMERIQQSPSGRTWVEPEEKCYCYPGGRMVRRGRALWPDGKIRAVRAGIADTYFSIPAYGRYRGHYVGGWLGLNEDREFVFHPNTSRMQEIEAILAKRNNPA